MIYIEWPHINRVNAKLHSQKHYLPLSRLRSK
jgi:hypothetical protein